MTAFANMTRGELKTALDALRSEYYNYKAQGLKLNMARGKPEAAQFDLSTPMLTNIATVEDCFSEDGTDCRNYGILDGLPEAKRLMAVMLDTEPENVFVYGNSSLLAMYDTLSRIMRFGVGDGKPWSSYRHGIKWICPVPGYDRHFAICEEFGIDMIPVPLLEDGPDMDKVEALVASDATIKGMWCVPKYSNPDGIIYSAETIRRIASMKPAAPDFLLMWDNAYCIHEFEGDYVEFPDILSECEKYGNADMVFEFASTSKVTLPGAGISCFACSEANMEYMKKLLTVQVISFDKVNQQRHVLYLKDKAHTLELMKRHAAIMGPKFRAVVDALDREIAPLNIASWRRPKGGYFVSLNAMPGTAKRTLALCKEAGVTMTGAGATFPYGKDPQDSNIRIAPSLPPVEELEQAIAVFCTCLKMAALEKLGV